MAHPERCRMAKESFVEKSLNLARKFESTEISAERKPTKPYVVKKSIVSEAKPTTSTQKPVLKRFEGQALFNDQTKSLSRQEKPRPQEDQSLSLTSSVELPIKPSDVSKALKKEPSEKNVSRCRPQQEETQSRTLTTPARPSDLSRVPRKDPPEKVLSKCRTSQESASGSSMILERIQKLKSAQEIKPAPSRKQSESPLGTPSTTQKTEIPQRSVKREDNERETFYKLIVLQDVSGRAPRKPARPPVVNLDSVDCSSVKNLFSVQTRQSKESDRSSRPISILTEEQETEEVLNASQRANCQNSSGSEDSAEELYQELD